MWAFKYKRQQIIHIAIFNLLPCIYTSHAFKFHNNSWLIWELFVQIKSVSILYNLLDILNDLSQKCLYMEYNNIKHCNFYCKSAEMFVARHEITTESDKLLGRPFMCNFLIISYHLRFDPLSLNISTKKNCRCQVYQIIRVDRHNYLYGKIIIIIFGNILL